MTDFGSDISTFPDLDPTFTPITGNQLVAEAVARRLATIRGALFYDTNYGFDLRLLLNDTPSASQLKSLSKTIEAECEKDERVQSAQVTLALSPSSASPTATLTVQIRITTANGPFTLVLAVSQVTISLVSFNGQ